jgi:hypothetical protein
MENNVRNHGRSGTGAIDPRKIVGWMGKELERWSKPLLVVTAVASVIWSALLIRVAKNEVHLLVWVRADTTLYPSKITGYQRLPLMYEGDTARSLRLLQLRIVNYGKSAIGSVDSLWSLTVSSPPGSQLAILNPPSITPATNIFSISPKPEPHQLKFRLGLFERRAQVDLQLLLINDTAATLHPIAISPSLAGLPRGITVESPVDSLYKRLLGPMCWTMLFFWLAVFARQIATDLKAVTGWRRLWKALGMGVAIIVLVAMTGAFTARGLAHVVSWLL